MMLQDVTFVTTFKPFEGEAGLLQRWAVESWRQLGLNFIICGDEFGAQWAADQLDAAFIKDIERRASGVPLLSSILSMAQQKASTEYIAYINGDIILSSTFAEVLNSAVTKLPETFEHHFLSAHRQNIPITHKNRTGEDFQFDVQTLANEYGYIDSALAIDLFVFTRGLFINVPDLAVGRSGWDNWLVAEAREKGAALIDLSCDATIYHPIHGYNGPQGGWSTLMISDDVMANQNIVSDKLAGFKDFTHRLIDGVLMQSDGIPQEFEQKLSYGQSIKEKRAACFYVTQADISDEERSDAIKTVLWRQEKFFPLETKAGYSQSIIRKATELAASDAFEEATNILQEMICDNLSAMLNENNTLFIWGTGGYALRFLDFAKRINLRCEIKAVQPDRGRSKQDEFPVPVVEPSKIPLGATLLITSIFARNIIEENRALFEKKSLKVLV